MNAMIKLKNGKISTEFLADGALTWRAKGVLAMVIHAPDSWNGSLLGMVNYSNEGRFTVQNALKELEAGGYARRLPAVKRGDPALFVLSTKPEFLELVQMEQDFKKVLERERTDILEGSTGGKREHQLKILEQKFSCLAVEEGGENLLSEMKKMLETMKQD